MSEDAATKVDAYMRFYIGDWLDGTADLTLEEEGAYLRLILYMWRRGGVLQLDHARLARMLKITEGRWRTLWLTLERMFVVHESNTFTHSRVARELEHARGRAAKGRAGAHGKWSKDNAAQDAQASRKHAPSIAPAMPSHSQGQGQRSESDPETDMSGSPPSVGVLALEPDVIRAARRPRPSEVDAVVAHYRTHHPRAFPNGLASAAKEARQIRARIAEGYTVDAICQAIDGYHVNPHHCGQNDRGQKYQSLDLIVRDGSHVASGIEYATRTTGAPVLAPKTQQTMNAMRAFVARHRATTGGEP